MKNKFVFERKKKADERNVMMFVILTFLPSEQWQEVLQIWL